MEGLSGSGKAAGVLGVEDWVLEWKTKEIPNGHDSPSEEDSPAHCHEHAGRTRRESFRRWTWRRLT